MKTPEEIKRGLEIYLTNDDNTCEAFCFSAHNDCPYRCLPQQTGRACGEIILDDILAYIQQLEQDNSQKDERIRQLERDNAYLMLVARDSCTMCKHVLVHVSDEPCESCINGHGGKDNWEWRGVEELPEEAAPCD